MYSQNIQDNKGGQSYDYKAKGYMVVINVSCYPQWPFVYQYIIRVRPSDQTKALFREWNGIDFV